MFGGLEATTTEVEIDREGSGEKVKVPVKVYRVPAATGVHPTTHESGLLMAMH